MLNIDILRSRRWDTQRWCRKLKLEIVLVYPSMRMTGIKNFLSNMELKKLPEILLKSTLKTQEMHSMRRSAAKNRERIEKE